MFQTCSTPKRCYESVHIIQRQLQEGCQSTVAVFGKMRKIWKDLKVKLYEAIILSTFLYGVWPLTEKLTKSLDVAHHGKHRSILQDISWKDRTTNVEIRTRTGQQTMDNILRERQLTVFN